MGLGRISMCLSRFTSGIFRSNIVVEVSGLIPVSDGVTSNYVHENTSIYLSLAPKKKTSKSISQQYYPVEIFWLTLQRKRCHKPGRYNKRYPNARRTGALRFGGGQGRAFY